MTKTEEREVIIDTLQYELIDRLDANIEEIYEEIYEEHNFNTNYSFIFS